MAKRNLSLEKILSCAAERIDRTGRNDVSLGELAEDLGVQPSALYNHVQNLDGLKHHIAVHSTEALADHLHDSVVAKSGAEAIRALAHGYRSFAVAHPGQHAAHLLPPSDPGDALADAHRRIVDVFVRVVESTGATDDAAVHAARTVRSAIHGFVALEAVDAFTASVDRATSFDAMVDSLVATLESSS